MNKWVLSTLIFLIILTGIVFSIDTSRDKVVSFTNQTLRIVNSRELLNSDVKIENTKIEPQKQQIEINTTKIETNNNTKLSNQDLMDLKFNELLNKKAEVKAIWDRKRPQKIKVNNLQTKQTSTNATVQKIEVTLESKDIKSPKPVEQTPIKVTQTQTTTPTKQIEITQNQKTQVVEKVAKLTPQVVTKPVQKAPVINFSSPSFQAELKTYLTANAKFTQGYVVNFSFLYSAKGDIAEIHIISIPEKDYLDGNDTYVSHIYGDVCKRDNLAPNEMYYNHDSSETDLVAIPINSTPDGTNLELFYNIVKRLGTSHSIEQVPYERQDNYSSLGGMYYQGNLYLYTN